MIQSSIKRLGFYFSELLALSGAYLVLIWYFASQGYVFSSYNREISWLIMALFGVGILTVTYHLLMLYKEEAQIMMVHARMPSFKTAVRGLLQKMPPITPEMLANGMRKTVDEHFAILEPSLIRRRIYQIVNVTLTTGVPVQETLLALLQQREHVKGARVRYIAGILIMIGLLGTFLGLVQSVKYLQHFFTATENVDFNTLFSDMKQTLGGLDKAFGTSIGGIMASLVLGYLNVVLRTKQTHILYWIEELSLEHLLPTLSGFHTEKTQDIASQSVKVLQRIPETLSQQLGVVLEAIITRTIGTSSENLKATATSLQYTADDLQKGQQLFSETLRSLNSFFMTFEEGKDQLGSNQETVALGIKKFSQALEHLESNQKMLISTLNTTQNFVETAESRLSAMDEVIQHMSQMWRDNQHAYAEIVETIQSEHEILTQTTQHFEQFITTTTTHVSTYFQDMQQAMQSLTKHNADTNRQLLEVHTLLTSLLHNMNHFILDEQNGLKLLASSMNDTFGEARFQYLQLTDHLEELYKRIHESQEQLSYVQETTASIQQQLQGET